MAFAQVRKIFQGESPQFLLARQGKQVEVCVLWAFGMCIEQVVQVSAPVSAVEFELAFFFRFFFFSYLPASLELRDNSSDLVNIRCEVQIGVVFFFVTS